MLSRISSANWLLRCEVLGNVNWLRIIRQREDNALAKGLAHLSLDCLIERLIAQQASTDQTPALFLFQSVSPDQTDVRGRARRAIDLNGKNIHAGDWHALLNLCPDF